MSNLERQQVHHLNRIATSLERLIELIEEDEQTDDVPTEFSDEG